MYIQRNFYDETKADLEQSEQRPLAAETTQGESLERALQRLGQACKKVSNPSKRTAFEALARRALDLAKFLCVNIKIETVEATKTSVGFIVLESDIFMLERTDSREYAQTIADLFTAADDIIFFVPDNALPGIRFTFFLCDLVQR